MRMRTSIGRALEELAYAKAALEIVQPVTEDQRLRAWAGVYNALTLIRSVDLADAVAWLETEHCAECEAPADIFDDNARPICARCAARAQILGRTPEVNE